MITGNQHSRFDSSWLVWTAASAMLAMAGCDSSQPPPAVDQNSNQQANARVLLETALGMLEPDRLDIKGDRTATLAILNDWLRSRTGKQEVAQIPIAQLETSVSPEVLSQIKLERFVIHDCDHLRTALMLKPLAQRLQSGASTDMERAVRLFQFVVRNVALEKQQETEKQQQAEMPHTPFHTLIYGQGRAEDRAWVFAEMLRQLQIDCVYLQSEAPENNQRPYGLVGVSIDGSLYLFDPWLGSPIPSADAGVDTVLVDQPATLTDVLETPELLRALDIADGPAYPLTVQQLAAARPMIIACSDHWSHRNKQLQYNLTGDRSLLIYDSLFNEEDGGDGLLVRLAAGSGGRWETQDFGIWSYIEQQVAILKSPTEMQLQRLKRMESCLAAPTPISVSGTSGVEDSVRYGQPTHKLFKARLAQLTGDYANGLKTYQSVRLQLNRLPPQQLLQLNDDFRAQQRTASEYAEFWIADTQLDQQLDSDDQSQLAAAGALKAYLRRFPSGRWYDAAAFRGGVSLASAGRWDQAVAMLSRIEPDAPQYLLARMLQARWQRHSTSPSSPTN